MRNIIGQMFHNVFVNNYLFQSTWWESTYLFFLNTSLGTNAVLWVTEKSPGNHPVGGLARRLVLFQERDMYRHDKPHPTMWCIVKLLKYANDQILFNLVMIDLWTSISHMMHISLFWMLSSILCLKMKRQHRALWLDTNVNVVHHYNQKSVESLKRHTLKQHISKCTMWMSVSSMIHQWIIQK